MSYLRNLEKAIAFIETHLKDSIGVVDVARAAGYSYFHFNRIFSAVVGESVGSYVRQRRLTDAARELLTTNKKVIDIAIAYCFESSEAFSRAFKAVYGVSPAGYRKNHLDIILGTRKPLDAESMRHLASNVTIKPINKEFDEIKVTGLRGTGTINDAGVAIRALWGRFLELMPELPHAAPCRRAFGITELNEADIYSLTGDTDFSAMVGAEVSSFSGIPAQFVTKSIPAGKFAVFTHHGVVDNLMTTYRYIWGTWFFNTRETVDSRESFELYDHRFLGPEHPDSQMDICIPIQ